jgi:hypothetical protein
MKTVGLAVVVYKRNYGSMLQAYATQEVVAKLGFHPEIIRMEPFSNRIRVAKAGFFANRLRNADERSYLTKMFATKLRRMTPTRFAANVGLRDEKYRRFVESRFLFSGAGSTIARVVERCREYHAVVVGSDQLWRPSNIEGDFFTLSFVPDEVKRVAYATSFGVSRLPEKQRSKAREFLSRFEYLSTREVAGREIIKEVSGRDAPVVCDPSMLMDGNQWQMLEDESCHVQGGYILCYFLGENPVFRGFARRLADFTGFKIVGLLHGATYIPGDDSFADIAMYDVGPSEFLNLVRNAAFVCTDSFHGTVFSILFERLFFSFRRFEDDSELSTNDRLQTLLGWAGLEERLLTGGENVLESIEKTIDYSEVLGRVARKREEGLAYLRAALGVD